MVGVLLAVVGCGDGDQAQPQRPVAPADLLPIPAALPAGFTVTQLSVPDLVAGNRSAIDSAKTTRIVPPGCAPTADAALNPLLTDANSAVLAARSSAASYVALVTTEDRDVAADRAAMTGPCATTTTTLDAGNLRGTKVLTRFTVLTAPTLGDRDSDIEHSLAVRSEVTTTLPDGGVRKQVGFAGYAVVTAPRRVSVQLTVSGEASAVSAPGAPEARASEPMSDDGFRDAFAAALRAALRA